MLSALLYFALVTQNVDGLHQAAGSRQVLELHGNIWRLRCTADVALVVGTSAVVQPAASLPLLCAQAGGSVIEVNADRTPLSSQAAVSLLGKAGEVLPRIVSIIREGRD
ncbi:MAG: Sir2 family NAD-dependent protein deacetylase [Armatimonadota bacterium]